MCIRDKSKDERQHLVAVSCQPEFASLPPSQIVPMLADQGLYLASESTFYRVLKAHDPVSYTHIDVYKRQVRRAVGLLLQIYGVIGLSP